MRWAEETREQPLLVANGSMAVMQVGSAILQMQALLRQPALPPGSRSALDATLRRLRRIGEGTERAQRSLAATARRLAVASQAEAGMLAASAEALRTDLAFFRQAGGQRRPVTRNRA